MEIHWLLLGVSMVIAILGGFYLIPKQSHLSKRKEQSAGFFKESIVAQKIEEITHKKVKASKILEIEKLIVQAGFRIKYMELVFISLLSAVVSVVLVATLTNNIALAILTAVGMFFFPKEILKFLRNRRVERMNNQVGPLMNMIVTRYRAANSFAEAIELSTVEFKGEEPLYSELTKTVHDMNLGMPVTKAFELLGVRSGNSYLQRMSDYYKISLNSGDAESRIDLINQAYIQFHENEKVKRTMKKELATVKRDAYIMLGAIPGVALFQIAVNPDFITFVTTDSIGKIGVSVIAVVFFGSIWFINNKISAPIE